MSEWYYVHGGQQLGPVPVSELQHLISSGALDAKTCLVWKEGMADWQAAATIPEVMPPPPDAAPTMAGTPQLGADPTFAAPAPGSLGMPQPSPGLPGYGQSAFSGVPEIEPGSQPLDIGACISRGFELTKRHFGIIFLTGLIYFGIMMGIGIVIGVADAVMGIDNTPQHPSSGQMTSPGPTSSASPVAVGVSFILNLISKVVSIFLSLGATRIGLKLVSGEPAEVGMLFGEGSKLLRTIGASILFGLMVFVGFLLLIVPGIYLAIRFGQFQAAIVDRDLGVLDSLGYSSDITNNNRMSLFGLAVLSMLIVLAGAIALCIGVIFAIPIVWLAGLTAYRSLQYGPIATQDRVA